MKEEAATEAMEEETQVSVKKENVQAGALQQLAAVGVIDMHLSEKPDITFFKRKTKQHSRFSIGNFESDEIKMKTAPDGTACYFHEISKEGDLLAKMSLVWEFDLFVGQETGSKNDSQEDDNSFAMVHNISTDTAKADNKTYNYKPSGVSSVYDLFTEVNFIIGKNVVSKLTSDAIHFIQRSYPNCQLDNRTWYGMEMEISGTNNRKLQMKLDLPFWFTEDYAQALPLIAMHNESISLEIKSKIPPTSVRCEYVYLSSEERKLFASAPRHQYMVNRMEYSNVNTQGQLRQSIWFKHPVRYLFFKVSDMVDDRIVLKVNGTPRLICDRGQVNYDNFYQSKLKPLGKYGLLSFCIDATDSVNPSGSLNFDRIDLVTIEGLRPGATVVANSWNVLCVQPDGTKLMYV